MPCISTYDREQQPCALLMGACKHLVRTCSGSHFFTLLSSVIFGEALHFHSSQEPHLCKYRELCVGSL